MSVVSDSTFHHRRVRINDIYWLGRDTRDLCAKPYPNHKTGCPNLNDCKYFRGDLMELICHAENIHLAWVEFDIVKYADAVKKEHPNWTKRQLHNLLYWQSSLRAKLDVNIIRTFHPKYGCAGQDYLIVMNAEGGGVNYYRTMRQLGVTLDLPKDLKTVRIIALIMDVRKHKQPSISDYYM